MTSLAQSACCVSFFQLSTKTTTIYSIPAPSLLLPGKSVIARVSGATSWRAMVTPSPNSHVSDNFDSDVIDSPPESSSECTSLGVSSFPAFQEFQRNCTNCTLQSFLSLVLAVAMASGIQGAPSSRDTFENVPQTLSGGDKAQRIQKPKSAKAEGCTRKCVSTCIRGGSGAPGEGPLNVRRPLVVFKEGFRSRQYCLIECSEICNLIGDGDDGP